MQDSMQERRAIPGCAAWHDAPDMCVLSGQGRHLGHIICGGDAWIAFDGTHPNADATGFQVIGVFRSVSEAKAAVEQASSESCGVGESPWGPPYRC